MTVRRLRAHQSSLARNILIAIGLPAALATVTAAGCGGVVIVEPEAGAGGGATTTSTTSSTTSTTTTTSSTTTSSTTTSTVTPGRPLTAAGGPRVAATERREDWQADQLVPLLDELDPPTREALAQAWERDGRFEHASIASFARFVLEAMAVGAPPQILRDGSQALTDEVRHAELCFALAGAYRGEPLGPAALAIEALPERTTLAEVAVATVHEGCITETLSTLVATAAADGALDPAARAALDEIAADETTHAALAWRFVAWAITQGADVRAAVAEAFEQGLQAEPPQELVVENVDEEQLRAHGVLPARERREVARQALTGVIEPCAQALLAGDTIDLAKAAQAVPATV